MLIDRNSPIEHLKAFAIVFAAGFLANEALSLYLKLVNHRKGSANPDVT